MSSSSPPPGTAGADDFIIHTKSLARTFKDTHAVRDLNLSIQRGEIFGLVGPDGAGKTTILRLLAGLLNITSGEAAVAGHDLRTASEAIKSHIGYMAQQFSLYGELSVLENLTFFADLFGVVGEFRRSQLAHALAFSRLEQFQDRRAAHLSGGMQKKLALACTLIHNPDILLLDEPTTGVDPVSRREFWDILTELHLAGTTILISTPYMDEAERCQRVGLMYAGQMMLCETPTQIRHMLHGELVELRPQDGRAAESLLQSLPGVIEVQTYGETLQVFLDDSARRIPELETALSGAGIACAGIRRAPVRMEQAFISLIRGME